MLSHGREALELAGDSRDTIRAFPDDVRKIAGFQLWRVQQGLEPNDWKALSSVGLGVHEIRIHTGVEHRVVYIAKFAEAVTCCTLLRNELGRRRRTISISPGNACAC